MQKYIIPEEMVGKTVEKVYQDYQSVGILFTDGTFTCGELHQDYDMEYEILWHMPTVGGRLDGLLQALGVLSAEEELQIKRNKIWHLKNRVRNLEDNLEKDHKYLEALLKDLGD